MKYVAAVAILALGYLFILPAPPAHALDGCAMYLTLGMQQAYDQCEAEKSCSLGTQEDKTTCCDNTTFCPNPKK
jgi:hypothetical protein